jgi:hypothetical protein
MPDKDSKLALQAVKRSNRQRVLLNIPVRVGRRQGTLIDLSEAGILATHGGVLKNGSPVEVSFTWDGAMFTLACRVESCTVVGLGGDGDDTGGPIYASRIFFTRVPDDARAFINRMLAG